MSFLNRSSGEEPIYKTNYLGFWIRVYKNRIEFKNNVGKKSIPISQVASVDQAMLGVLKITIETTGGKKYKIPTLHKKEVAAAIYNAQLH